MTHACSAVPCANIAPGGIDRRTVEVAKSTIKGITIRYVSFASIKRVSVAVTVWSDTLASSNGALAIVADAAA